MTTLATIVAAAMEADTRHLDRRAPTFRDLFNNAYPFR
jgi:hypothetical protein